MEFSKVRQGRSALLMRTSSLRPLAFTAVLCLFAATGLEAGSLSWTGAVNGNWNTSTANWTGDATVFTDGDAVTFASGANRSIAIAATYSPASLGFNNASGTDFTFTGGGISGSGALTKAGAGDAIFDATTSFAGYAGAIGLTGGRLLRQQNSGAGSFGSGVITLDGGALGAKYTAGWQGTLTITNPISVTASGGSLVGLHNDGNLAAYTGGITLADGSALQLDASGSVGSAYTLTLGAITLAGNATIKRNYTDTFLYGGVDGRRQVLLNAAIAGAGCNLTLDSINTRLQSTGSLSVSNLMVAKELWVENRSGTAFVTLGAGGKVNVASGGLLALGSTTLAAANLVLESGSQLRHLVGNWSSQPTISGTMAIGANRTVWLSQQGGNDTLTFSGGVTFESGSLLMVAPGQRDDVSSPQRSSGIGGTATFLGGTTIEGRITRANGTAVRSGTLVFGDADANTAETVMIRGYGAGVMAFVASTATDVGGLTLRYAAATNTSPFKVGWGAAGWNSGTADTLGASLIAGSAVTEFAPQVGTGDNGKVIAIGTTAGTVFTASQPATVVSAGTIEFRRSASGSGDNWQPGALGPVAVTGTGSLGFATNATIRAGDVAFGATTTFSVYLSGAAADACSLLDSAGTLTFTSGAALAVTLANGFSGTGGPWRIATAATSVSGLPKAPSGYALSLSGNDLMLARAPSGTTILVR